MCQSSRTSPNVVAVFSATVVFISRGIVPESFLPRMHMRAEVLP